MRHLHPAPASNMRGMALLLVLWACALMTVMLGSFAILARTEALQTRYQSAHVQARYAAEAGLARAIAGLQAADPAQRWQADGRAYTVHFQRATITVRITDEDGKVDINTAKPAILERLLQGAGLDKAKAHRLTQAIIDWRDSDDRQQPGGAEAARYHQAGRSYGPRNGPFASIQELQQVLGMTPQLYARLAPMITIWSGRIQPNPLHAAPAVLAAIPGMSRQSAQRFVHARRQMNLLQGKLPTLPDGVVIRRAGGGSTHTIVSRAHMANGTRATLRATVRRRGVRPNGRPYVTLSWHLGEAKT